MTPTPPPFGDDLAAWSRAVSNLLDTPAVVLSVTGDPAGDKAHGMTQSVELTVQSHGRVRRAYLKTPREDLYGETLAADALREAAWRVEGYDWFPGHARCAAVGRSAAGSLVRLEPLTDTPWLLEWAEPGIRYADRLDDLEALGADRAAAEAHRLCSAMVALHRPVAGDQTVLYRRALRDALIVPVQRLVDSADSFWATRRDLRVDVEHACAQWRLLLTDRGDRLRYVHHDFHPWNVFIGPCDREVRTIGARLPGVGDPNDDFAAFTVNYLWFSHASNGRVSGAYRAGLESFRRTFRELGGDDGGPALMAPFLAKRLLVLLNPTYYPAMPPATGAWLEDLLRRCLRDEIDLVRGDVDLDFVREPTGVT